MGLQNTCCGWQHKLDSWFKRKFYNLGFYIGEKYGYFLLIPFLLSLLLGSGLQQIQYENDPGYIFTPRNGKAKTEREIVENLFPVDYSGGFNPSRFHRPGRYARLIITAQDGGSLFHQAIWDELKELDNLVRTLPVTHDETAYTFEQLCARWGADCYGNDVLDLSSYMTQIGTGQMVLTYPITMLNNKVLALATLFGGLDVVPNPLDESISICTGAKAVQLNYFLDADSPKRDERGSKWEERVLGALEKAETSGRWKFLKVHRFTERSLPDQMNENVMGVMPYAAVTGPLMVGFAFISCMMGWDWVRSKPWLGIVGVVTPTLGTLASFGLLCYCGVPMIGLNVAAPFLMMGIGMDDAFVILAAWRQTSVHDPIPKRLAEAYSEAAVSITITSLTDFLSFVIGLSSPFVSIQIFSAYTATAVFFTYVLHIFFFGGAMALSGYHEAQNRHCVLWWLKAIPLSQLKKSPSKSRLSRFFKRGGCDPSDPHNPIDIQENGIMTFFRDTWASLLLNPYFKAFVLLFFCIYLGISGWGISRLQEGMELKRIATDGGYLKSYYDMDDKYFQEFPYRIQIVMKGSPDLKFSDKNVQEKIELMMTKLENTSYTAGGALYSESWLRTFLNFTQSTGIPIETEKDFIGILEQFLKDPAASVFSLDIKFSSDKSYISSSRFILQTVNLSDWKDRRDMLTTLRSMAREEEAGGFEITIFNPLFMFVDQFLVIRSSTIQLVAIAAGVMMVVSLVFIPNPICSVWVALAVLSIEAGVLGFLSWWNVNLDVLSMIYLVMSVGFSVDFSAHISYAYMSNTRTKSKEERLRAALHSLGLPILQGAISTILGVMSLVFAPAYDFIAFFKAVFLVMVIATAHGLLLLPVLLTMFGGGGGGKDKKKVDEKGMKEEESDIQNNNKVE